MLQDRSQMVLGTGLSGFRLADLHALRGPEVNKGRKFTALESRRSQIPAVLIRAIRIALPDIDCFLAHQPRRALCRADARASYHRALSVVFLRLSFGWKL